MSIRRGNNTYIQDHDFLRFGPPKAAPRWRLVHMFSEWHHRAGAQLGGELADPTARFRDLGADYQSTRIATECRIRSHIAQLTALGYRIPVEPAA